MLNCLRDAGLKPTDVDGVNMHGTSTPLGDMAESKAILHVFGEHAYTMNLNSTKSMTGHLLGAAGAAEAIFSVLALRDGVLPATINLDTPDPACDLDCVPNEARAARVDIALTNAFGFGGSNGTLIAGRYRP